MEGPSLVIATEEFRPWLNKRIAAATGTANVAPPSFVGKKLGRVYSWGKHLLFEIGRDTYRVHFLMFGSYRIDNPRKGRVPKLHLEIAGHVIDFYSCAIGKADPSSYDWAIDVMSDEFDVRRAGCAIAARPDDAVCDILMNQEIFAGVGNIIKNEVLYLLRMHPETRVSALSPAARRKLVRATRAYCFQFYEWKKQLVLKRNWKIMRKRKCPTCGGPVTKRHTGKLRRLSHFCRGCQPKPVKPRGTS